MTEKIEKKIGKGFSFGSKRTQSTIITYHKAIEKYYAGFKSANKLTCELPIFLDTNVLLRIYSISFVEREKLKSFFVKYSHRIILTNQIQKEFTKNRESTIETFFSYLSKELVDDFKKNVVNKIQHYLDNNKVELKDFKFVSQELIGTLKSFDILNEKLKSKVNEKKEDNIGIKHKDEILEVYANFKMLESLSNEEISFLKQEYDALKNNLNIDKLDTELDKPNMAFPGAGDCKKKTKDPYGDYIIFHEILKYINKVSTNAIFITYDATKKDWLKSNKEPHLHYIENVYLNTESSLFIIDAQSLFEEKLNSKFESLVANDTDTNRMKILKVIFIQDWQTLLDFTYQMIKDRGISYKSYRKMTALKIFRMLYEFDLISEKLLTDLIKLRQYASVLSHEHSINEYEMENYSKKLDKALSTMFLFK